LFDDTTKSPITCNKFIFDTLYKQFHLLRRRATKNSVLTIY